MCLLFLCRMLQEQYMYYPDLRSQHKDAIERKTAEMDEEVQTLDRKLFLEETALDVTDERCDFLERNLRWVSIKSV